MNKIKSIFLIVLFICLAFITFGCTGGKKSEIEEYIKTIGESINDCKELVSTRTITDSEILVYEQTKEIIYLEEEKANVTTKTKKLSESSFAFEENTSAEYEVDVKKASLFTLNCTKEQIKDYVDKDGKIEFKVDNENIKTVLSDDKLNIVEDATFVIELSDKHIVSFTCTYKKTANLVVCISSIYSY